jgi:fatty acid desaturase
MHVSMPSMRRSRHPLVRAFSLLLGVALVGVLLIFGLVVVSVLLIGGVVLLAWRHWKLGSLSATTQPGAPDAARKPAVLEGEFVVVQHGRPVAH